MAIRVTKLGASSRPLAATSTEDAIRDAISAQERAKAAHSRRSGVLIAAAIGGIFVGAASLVGSPRRRRGLSGLAGTMPAGCEVVRIETGGKHSFAFDAVCEGERVGGIKAHRTRVAGKVRYAVSDVFVDKSFRRRGVATRLYEVAALESCVRRVPLASTERVGVGISRAFWDKQVRKGRARVLSPGGGREDGKRSAVFELSCPAPSDLSRAVLSGLAKDSFVPAGKRDSRRTAWLRQKQPRTVKACYARKADALNVFREHNRTVIDNYGGETIMVGPSEFDAINHKLGLKGNRRVRNIAEAIFVSMPPGKPYCLDEIDIDALNDTSPGRAADEQLGIGFELPEAALDEEREREKIRFLPPSTPKPPADWKGQCSDWKFSAKEHRRFLADECFVTPAGGEACVCRTPTGRFTTCEDETAAPPAPADDFDVPF